MTAKEKQGFGLYFLFAFGMAWLCQVGGCMALLQQNNAVLYQLALIVTMFCPLLAVLLVQKAFLRQPTGIGWKVQGKRRFWLAAWFGPAVLTLLGAVLYFAVFPSRAGLFRQLAGSRLRRRDGRPDPAQPAGGLHPQLSAAKRAVCGAPCPGHQYVPRTGRGGRLARLHDAPPEGAVRPAEWPPAGRRCAGHLALAADAAGGLRVRHQLLGAHPCWVWWCGAWSALP